MGLSLKCQSTMIAAISRQFFFGLNTGVLISPSSDQEENKLQRQKILSFMYPIYNYYWRNISTIYIYVYNKTSIKRNILTKQNTSGSRLG